MKTYIYLVLLITIFSLNSCAEDYLTENPASELAPEAFLSTSDGLQALFNNAYDVFTYRGYNDFGAMSLIALTEFPGDSYYQTGGGYNAFSSVMLEFSWNSTTVQLPLYWNRSYAAIRDINIILENLNAAQGFTEQEIVQYGLSCRLIRAEMYMRMYDMFGPIPLRTATTDEPALPRNTDEEVQSFIESEMEEIIPQLAMPSEAVEIFMDRGTAAGLYARYLLNIKDWQRAANYSKLVMDLGYYSLFPDYPSLFDTQNDIGVNPNNKEVMLARPAISTSGNMVPNNFFPPGFKYSDKLPDLVFTSSMVNFGSNFRLRDDFTDSFDKVNDIRYTRIFEDYINGSGDLIDLRAEVDNARSLKFYDPDATYYSGNDIPNLRYADILLMRSEALNELNDPNQESIDLLNMVRNRANLLDFQVSDFPTKESFRDHIILNERRWEFNLEGTRRRDLIRHGTFISQAQARGKAAQDFHVKFAIPQGEINGNPNMVQNPGY